MEFIDKFKELPWKKIAIGALVVLILGLLIDLVFFGAAHGVTEAITANFND